MVPDPQLHVPTLGIVSGRRRQGKTYLVVPGPGTSGSAGQTSVTGQYVTVTGICSGW
jgi:hypothetical protein